MQLAGISHVMLGVGDVDASLRFYRDALGMSVAQQFPGFAFLKAGPVTLCLSQPLAGASDHKVGATEIVFSVPDVHAAHAALNARGVTFLNEPRQVTASDWAANFVDPDGHRLSIFGPPETVTA